ncbi:DUF1932 domain-containing protein [Lentibacillus salicampi]|uniref:NAD(P)-dependent oxidoreductase n=1 Tax=Lentibacillus salicampi TaxID=175306 RepID=A0A4Y9AA41_9BACI|nr:DUF1932 domain-containing protein [Lentibacillus salicampi]TFJ91224.1 NAD(P)-dependent oxidoreductase [Lentibacillus salicampi]
MKIGFIGFGEVGYQMSKGFKEENNIRITAFDKMHQTTLVQSRAEEAGVVLYESPFDAIEGVDVIIVAVPADHTFNAWQSIKGAKPETLKIDVTTANSNTKQQVFEEIMSGQGYFVDAALMGPLPAYKHKVPIIASGSGVNVFINMMEQHQMKIENIGDQVGDAINIKLIRSIFMKGMSTLLYEVLDIAHHLDVEDRVIKSISETMERQSFDHTVTRLVSGTAIHSARRTKEMENVIELLNSNQKPSQMSQATLDKLSWITELNLASEFHNKTPDDWKKVLNKINEKRGSENEETRT